MLMGVTLTTVGVLSMTAASSNRLGATPPPSDATASAPAATWTAGKGYEAAPATAVAATDSRTDSTAAGAGRRDVDAGSAHDDGGAGEPPSRRQPDPPSNPIRTLDASFGESMFAVSLRGLKRISAFASGDDEVAAVYETTGEGSYDLLRLTIRRTSAPTAAKAALAEVQELFPDDPLTFTWGGRDIAQATASGGVGEDPVLSMAWTQGRYAIDASIFPPYDGGVAAARAALLRVVGRLPY